VEIGDPLSQKILSLIDTIRSNEFLKGKITHFLSRTYFIYRIILFEIATRYCNDKKIKHNDLLIFKNLFMYYINA